MKMFQDGNDKDWYDYVNHSSIERARKIIKRVEHNRGSNNSEYVQTSSLNLKDDFLKLIEISEKTNDMEIKELLQDLAKLGMMEERYKANDCSKNEYLEELVL